MNRTLVHVLAALAAGGLAPLAQAETFNSALHARAFEAAERGADSLRSFINRTRMIHALNYADYSRAIPASTAELASNGADPGFSLLPTPDELATPVPVSPEQRVADELREQIMRDLAHE